MWISQNFSRVCSFGSISLLHHKMSSLACGMLVRSNQRTHRDGGYSGGWPPAWAPKGHPRPAASLVMQHSVASGKFLLNLCRHSSDKDQHDKCQITHMKVPSELMILRTQYSTVSSGPHSQKVCQ
ncbi:hypothetical protein L210DRAFT_2887129 [Boletus edulis BED1]|uniref:Uncharacterized protein n=1 Tax=Boletus edulis BED1 TaxID=1328754 RepID=A0AAD4BJG3_BOLED|nr:hypothetical protein L210DRAFT_2887129 [Boletus edulis BED1]